MAESSNIARPYARAVFDLARQQDDLAGWSDRLDLLAAIAADEQVAALVRNPRVSAAQLQQVVLDVASASASASATALQLGEQCVNLVKLLARNGRIGVLPEIAESYAALRAEAEGVVAATLITAGEIDQRQRAQFTEALQSRLGRRVTLEFEVDRALVGGAVVRAGDWVFDGSVRAQLEQLVGALGA